MKSKITMVGLALCLGLAGCTKEGDESSACKTYTIDYEVGSGFGMYSQEATIDQTGLLKISKVGFNVNNVSEYHISDAELSLIRQNLREVTTINLADDYTGTSSMTDQPVTSLKYSADGFRKDSTYILNPDPNQVPSKLTELIFAIENVMHANDTVNKR